MTIANTSDGQTPLSPDEMIGLIPDLSTKEELDEWERKNIVIGTEWALSRPVTVDDLISEAYIRQLHRRMFDQTWKWAGQPRKSEKNIGVPVHEIRERLAALLGDVRFWIQNHTYTHDEIAVRFHHRLVFIHLFPNGNGRHARLMADLLAIAIGGQKFSWGRRNLVKKGEARAIYLSALQIADGGDINPLIQFARS